MDLTRWESEMDRMMDEFFGRRFRPRWPFFAPRGGEDAFIAPSIDVYEDKDDIVVKAELPGLDKNDIEVKISDSEVTLKGEKKNEEKIEEENYYRCERSYGSFLRSVDLPTGVQADKAKASFSNRIPEIRMPKSEEAKAKEIR